jgi:hypothetical protein
MDGGDKLDRRGLAAPNKKSFWGVDFRVLRVPVGSSTRSPTQSLCVKVSVEEDALSLRVTRKAGWKQIYQMY